MEAAALFISIALVLLTLSISSLAQGFSLTLLHTNDNHARFEETDTYGFLCYRKDAQEGKCFGGMARKATMIKKIRSQTKNVLLVSGGDVFTGTVWYQVYRGNATRTFMNELGYDIMTLGNHEFDDGVDNLVSFLSQLNFTVVVSNLNVTQEPKWPSTPPLIVKSKVVNVGNERIGFVGYVLKDTPRLSKPGPGPNIRFLPEVESVRKAVEELKQQNINKIIAVGHAGIEMDKRIAKEVDGVDIVVGGHTNTFLYTGEPPSTEIPYGKYPLEIRPKSNPLSKKVLVVQAFAYGKYLGNLTVDFDDNGDLTSWSGNPILLDNSVAKDPRVLGQVQQWKAEVAEVSEVPVGSSFVFLNATKPGCMFKECNLGNVVTDAMVFHYANLSANEEQWTDASIALQNSGSITASIAVNAQDTITYGHIINSFPYKNTVDLVELKGKDLLKVFEQVASMYSKRNPSVSFLQVSGLQIKYDMTKPKGSKVVDIQVRCVKCQVPVYEPLNLFAVYKVILSSYMARGGAGLSVINEKKVSHEVGNITDDVLMMNYFKAKSPIMTGEENRITFVKENDKEPSVCGGGGNLQAVKILLALAVFACSVVKHII